jgi:hypothetical protein
VPDIQEFEQTANCQARGDFFLFTIQGNNHGALRSFLCVNRSNAHSAAAKNKKAVSGDTA